MGKKTKIGKQRKDKFYKLAKETGYRSRAAFKLVQLNRKFDFLARCQVVVDLCAAPGGWLQVAAEYTPMSSLIIGVDLVSMKPINNVITLQEDITTEKCRQAIKNELKTWEADCVLHDGAPNVGKNWLHDAFSQAQLTLSAFRLATEVLRKGGWFVTKVFRSKDYAALLDVFKELFNKVHATKPQASRNESAEIFVVCQGFKKPGKIDPKFLDVKQVFKEHHLDPEKPKLNVLHPEKKKKKKAEGYTQGDYTVYHKVPASEFLRSHNYLEILGRTSEIVLDDDEIRGHPLTTGEIKECIADIQILGRKELRDVLNWRKSMRQILMAREEEKTSGGEQEELEATEELTEEERKDLEMEASVSEAKASEKSHAKRLKKKAQKEKKVRKEKLNLKMVIPGDQPDAPSRDDELFDLVRLHREKKKSIEKGDIDLSSDFSDSESGMSDDNEEVGGASLEIPADDWLEEEESANERRTKAWFQQEAFKGLVTEEDEDEEIERMMALARSRGGQKVTREEPSSSAFAVDKENDDDEGSDFEFELVGSDDENKSGVKRELTQTIEDESSGFRLTKKQKRMKLDAEGLALGATLIHSSKAKRDIIEFAYNRYTNNDTDLPQWFAEDEKKHYRKPLPVSQDLVNEYKGRMLDLNAKTIKKVSEAKARKKKRAIRKMEKARKKAENVVENPELTEKEKSSEMRRIYKKAGTVKERKRVTLVPVKKGMGKKVGRPKGVKGKFKTVDARMKKETRKMKQNMGKKGGKKQQKGAKRGKKGARGK